MMSGLHCILPSYECHPHLDREAGLCRLVTVGLCGWWGTYDTVVFHRRHVTMGAVQLHINVRHRGRNVQVVTLLRQPQFFHTVIARKEKSTVLLYFGCLPIVPLSR